jgi:hypothetical protein
MANESRNICTATEFGNMFSVKTGTLGGKTKHHVEDIKDGSRNTVYKAWRKKVVNVTEPASLGLRTSLTREEGVKDRRRKTVQNAVGKEVETHLRRHGDRKS